jgi:hypothetical protein
MIREKTVDSQKQKRNFEKNAALFGRSRSNAPIDSKDNPCETTDPRIRVLSLILFPLGEGHFPISPLLGPPILPICKRPQSDPTGQGDRSSCKRPFRMYVIDMQHVKPKPLWTMDSRTRAAQTGVEQTRKDSIPLWGVLTGVSVSCRQGIKTLIVASSARLLP